MHEKRCGDFRRFAAVIAAAITCLARPAVCDDEWIELFDGKTLDGWSARGDVDMTVQDGRDHV